MKYDFNKSFQQDVTKQDIPKSVLKVLNMSLPKGYEYKYNEETGRFMVAPTGDPSGRQIRLTFDADSYTDFPEWAKKDPNSFAEYLYRMQITMKISEAFIVNPDGTSTPASEVFKEPFSKRSYLEAQYIVPEPFKKLDPITFETSSGETIAVTFERKPYPERGFVLLESVSSSVFKLSFVIPENKSLGKGSVNLSVFPQQASCVRDVIVAYSLVLGIINGSLKVNGKNAPYPMDTSSKHEKEVLEHKLMRWQELLKLEEILKVHFNPAEKMSLSDEQFLTELSTVFIKKEELIYDEPYEYAHVNKEAVESEEFQTQINNAKRVAFSFVREPEEHILMGATIRLSIVMIIEDVKISYVETDNEGAKLHFQRALKTPWRVYKTYAVSEEQAVEAQQRIIDKWIRPRQEIDD